MQKLQREEIGAQGNKLAKQMNVSTGYILKLTKAAEQKGYVRRGKARLVYITESGIAAMQEYLLAAQVMKRFFFRKAVYLIRKSKRKHAAVYVQ